MLVVLLISAEELLALLVSGVENEKGDDGGGNQPLIAKQHK